MFIYRSLAIAIFLSSIGALLLQWNIAVGFNPLDMQWWAWVIKVIAQTGSLPEQMLYPIWWTGAAMLVLIISLFIWAHRPSTRTVSGDADARNTHGSAKWAVWSNVKRAGLVNDKGVTVGGFKKGFSTKHLKHDGPEHVMAFAPTRSGKGVGLVLPTLLSWLESTLVLDIKGENYALTAGWRKTIGQRVLRFDPAALKGSVRYNPLAEVRIGTDHEMADCQNIASIIIDPDAKGLKEYFIAAGWEWLSAVILHVLYRMKRDNDRVATLADVHAFMSIGEDMDDMDLSNADENFDYLLDDMMRFDHGRESVNLTVRKAAAQMHKKAPNERSGVHSSASVQLALYSDPIVARNISECDFRIDDLMNGDTPTSLYLVIPPSDIQRLKPLIRIMMNQFLTRLTSKMEFEGGATKKHYKYRMLLMLDELPAIDKLEIFEKALAYMAGYGLKAFIIIQDRVQLQKAYGREESLTSNCHVRIAYAPNNVDTAKYLSDLTGKTTVVQKKRSRSHGKGGSISESLSEVARPLMTPDECMALPGIHRGLFGRIKPGDMLIFVAGHRPIYGRQILYFQDKVLSARAEIEAPGQNGICIGANEYMPVHDPKDEAAAACPVDVYQNALMTTDAAEDRAAAQVDELYQEAMSDKTEAAQ